MTAMARQLRRDPVHGLIGGVCAGIARRLGIDPIIPRAAAVVIAVGTSGIGVIAYLIGWALLPAAWEEQPPPPPRPRRRRGSWRIAAGVGLLALSVLLVFRQLDLWLSDALIWPLVLAAFGAALIWNLTRTPPEREHEPPGPDAAAARRARSRRQAGRLSLAGFGAALVLGAGLLFLWANGALDAAGDVALAALVVIVAVALVLAPFWWWLGRSLASERGERIRSQERAEMAAHLHDSVLQTLALVRQRAGSPSDVERLARRQERELRAWLAGNGHPRPDERLADALRAAAEQVEDAYGAAIEVVVVGDAPLDENLEGLVAATREALTNASKFAADGGPIRLYAEVDDRQIRVFVDDRGPGFDLERISTDRRGLRESIVGRMERLGGRAEIRSDAGKGTEVSLTIERARA
jgi:signal transduction histidine kinase/phage shock protein PspC (stress-responsive transcriptional regulator)